MKELRIPIRAHDEEDGITLAMPKVQVGFPELYGSLHQISKPAHKAEMEALEALYPLVLEAVKSMATPQVKIVGPTGKPLVPDKRQSPPQTPTKKPKKQKKGKHHYARSH